MACADSPERVKECTIASNGYQKPLAPLKSEIRRTAVELSIDRRKGRNLKRFANGIPKGIPIKNSTEDNL
jgi:hypothetical protein